MAIKTVSPDAGELRREGPVGSFDVVENGDYRCLDIGLPQEIERLKQHGALEAARRACSDMLDADLEPELAACLRAERHRMGRLARQFCISRARAIELIRAEWPDFDEQRLDDLVERKRIDYRFIDGEVRFLANFLDSLRVYPVEVPGLLPDSPTEARDAMLMEMREAGGSSRSITIRAKISVPGRRAGEVVRAWLPIPARAPQQSHIEILSTTEGGIVAREEAPLERRTGSFRPKNHLRLYIVIASMLICGYDGTGGRWLCGGCSSSVCVRFRDQAACSLHAIS